MCGLTPFPFSMCGADSGFKTTIYVCDTKYILSSARQAFFQPVPDFTGHTWWGFESDENIKELIPEHLLRYVKRGGFFCASIPGGLFGGTGELLWDNAAQGTHYESTEKEYPVLWYDFIDGVVFVKVLDETTPSYHLIDYNCADVAIEVGENANKPTMSRRGWTKPVDVCNWLISN